MRAYCSATIVMFLPFLCMFESAQVTAATASAASQWYTYPTSFPLHFVCESTTFIPGWFRFGASWYQADLSKPQTFAQAALTCQEQGAFLVSVNSTEEGQMVSQLVGSSVAWIGASQTAPSMATGESAWSWTDGTQMDGYANWADNEPRIAETATVAVAMNSWFHQEASEPPFRAFRYDSFACSSWMDCETDSCTKEMDDAEETTLFEETKIMHVQSRSRTQSLRSLDTPCRSGR